MSGDGHQLADEELALPQQHEQAQAVLIGQGEQEHTDIII